MILTNEKRIHYVIKMGDKIISRHENDLEAQFKLLSLKTENQSMYESAKILLVNNDDKELLLG